MKHVGLLVVVCCTNKIVASRDLRVGCLWGYPCAAVDPCPPGTECVERAYDEFECRCRADDEHPDPGTEAGECPADGVLPLAVVDGPLRLRALVVREGFLQTVTTDQV